MYTYLRKGKYMTKEIKIKLKISTILIVLLCLLALALCATIIFPKLILGFFGMFFIVLVWGTVKIAKYMNEEVGPYELQSYFFAKNVDIEKIIK